MRATSQKPRLLIKDRTRPLILVLALFLLLAGCAGFIRATGKGVSSEGLVPPKTAASSREAFPVQAGGVSYKEPPGGAIGTYELVAGNVIRDIVLSDNPAPVIARLITQELEQKGIKNRPSDLVWNATITNLYVNGDRGGGPSSQTYSAFVAFDLTISDAKTGTRTWSKRYSGSGSAGDPQAALASAFHSLAFFVRGDNSILALRGTPLASKADDGPPTAVPAGSSKPDELEKRLKAEGMKADRKPPSITIISPEVKRGVRITLREETILVKGIAEDESGVSAVKVNGQSAEFDDSGNFSAEVRLRLGENRISVMATDTFKNTARETFTVVRREGKPDMEKQATAPVVSASALSVLAEGKYYGYVIGINSYQHLPKLRTAVNDARAVAGVLQEYYGFEVELVLDQQATRDNIIRGFNALRRKLTPSDRLLIYYAGHGDHNRETDAAYWLPVDAEKGDTTNWIDAKSVTDLLKLTTARHVLIVADSCYSGTLTRKAATNIAGGQTRDAFLRKLLSKTSRVLIASGGNEPVTDSGGGEHSVFADVFLRALKNPEQNVYTAEELHTNAIKESVAGRSEQTPEYRIIRASGHDGGDFIFIKKR